MKIKKINESRKGFIKKYKGCNILDAGDVFVVTNQHGLTIGETKTIPGAEGIIDDYTSDKDGFINEDKNLSEGKEQKLISDVNALLNKYENSFPQFKGVRNLSRSDLETIILYAQTIARDGTYKYSLMKPRGGVAEVLAKYGLLEEELSTNAYESKLSRFTKDVKRVLYDELGYQPKDISTFMTTEDGILIDFHEPISKEEFRNMNRHMVTRRIPICSSIVAKHNYDDGTLNEIYFTATDLEMMENISGQQLTEGTSNFWSMDKFPLLVFKYYGEEYDYVKQDAVQLIIDEHGEDYDYTEDELFAAIDKAWENHGDVCILDEDEVDNLKDDISEFNYEMETLRYEKEDEMDDDFDECTVSIKSGYYEGAQLYVADEDYLADWQVEKVNEFLKRMKDKYHLTQIGVSYRFSNGETGYHVIKEDTVKTSKGKWTNKGKEGTHGTFKTKKAANAQRKAMFANGYNEGYRNNMQRVLQSEVDKALKSFGRVGAKLYDELDDNGFYLTSNNKVEYKIANGYKESIKRPSKVFESVVTGFEQLAEMTNNEKLKQKINNIKLSQSKKDEDININVIGNDNDQNKVKVKGGKHPHGHGFMGLKGNKSQIQEGKKKKSNDGLGTLHPVPDSFDIEQLSTFRRDAKRLKLTSEDIEDLKTQMKSRPPKASIGASVFKFEWTPERLNLPKGENRVYYIEFVSDSKVWLATIFTKSEKSDITPNEQDVLKTLSKSLKGGNK